MNGMFFCNKCGAQNAAGAQFCSRCGTATSPASGVVPPAAPSSAASYPAPAYQAAVHGGYGGFWIRVVAAIIDNVILRVVVAPVGLIFGGLGFAGGLLGGLPHVGVALLGGGLTFVFFLFGKWLYEAFMESSSYQATIGKMICGLRVTDLNGNRISFERATGRYFAKFLSVMFLGFGFLMAGFTERKQGLHDLLAGTLVRKS